MSEQSTRPKPPKRPTTYAKAPKTWQSNTLHGSIVRSRGLALNSFTEAEIVVVLGKRRMTIWNSGDQIDINGDDISTFRAWLDDQDDETKG